jgi:hypothetical protein
VKAWQYRVWCSQLWLCLEGGVVGVGERNMLFVGLSRIGSFCGVGAVCRGWLSRLLLDVGDHDVV